MGNTVCPLMTALPSLEHKVKCIHVYGVHVKHVPEVSTFIYFEYKFS